MVLMGWMTGSWNDLVKAKVEERPVAANSLSKRQADCSPWGSIELEIMFSQSHVTLEVFEAEPPT